MTDAGAKDIVGYAATAVGLALNLKEFFRSSWPWIILKTIVFLISTVLTVFNTYTDWKVVFNYQEVGFNNPLLPRSVDWLRALFLFASIGTILAVISVLHGGLVLFYSEYRGNCSCSYKSSQYELNPLNESLLTEENRSEENMPDTESGENPSKTEKNTDPCKPCYRCGCNIVTRNETLGVIALWFQDVPMLTIAVLYAFSQTTCKTPEVRDVTPFLRDIGISATAATLASFWRLIRSFVYLYQSVGVRINEERAKKKKKEGDDKKNDKKEVNKCVECVQYSIPKEKGVTLYPPGTCTQYCIFPFFCELALQLSAIFMAGSVTAGVWISYGILQHNSNVDDSLGIYRFSVDNPDVRLFNISGNIIPPNGTFVHLEDIPSSELPYNGDVFCLSEFEYQSEESQNLFNAAKLIVVSDDGRFCVSIAGPELPNTCTIYYTYRDFILYYASVNPTTGDVIRFDLQCSVLSYDLNAVSGPTSDFSIDVTRHINRNSFPLNDEPLIVFYPSPVNIYINVSEILSDKLNIIHTFQDLKTSANVTCIVSFEYHYGYGRINFNYRDFYQLESNCFCSFSPGPNCQQFHNNLVYAYLTKDRFAVQYTHCSEIPQQKLVPYHDRTINIECPC